MIFYEAPHKLPYTLQDLFQTLGDRPVALCRELTKIHEEVIVTTLSEAVARYETEAPRGEFVVIVGGAPAEEAAPPTPEEAAVLARALIEDEGVSMSEAAKRIAAETGLKKSDIYRLLVE